MQIEYVVANALPEYACSVRERLDAALRRVEDMESCVTSRQYDLNKEFSKLQEGGSPQVRWIQDYETKEIMTS